MYLKQKRINMSCFPLIEYSTTILLSTGTSKKSKKENCNRKQDRKIPGSTVYFYSNSSKIVTKEPPKFQFYQEL